MNIEVSRKTLLTVGGMVAGTILLLGGIFWAHRTVHLTGKIDVSPYENDMMESLVRSLLHESSLSNAPVCFLCFGETRTSPSSSFLARFANCRRPAICSVGNSVSPPTMGYMDKSDGRPGTIIQIINFKPFAPGIFDITVAISNLPSGHDHIVYRISDVGAEWVITKRTAS
jgi:hypothetical protein